jgi:hypothetical protein
MGPCIQTSFAELGSPRKFFDKGPHKSIGHPSNLGLPPSRAVSAKTQHSVSQLHAFNDSIERRRVGEKHEHNLLPRRGRCQGSSRGKLLISNAGGGGGLAKKGPKKKRKGASSEVHSICMGNS